MRRRNGFFVILSATLILTGWVFAQKEPGPKPPEKASLAPEHVKELMLLMDTDKNGKISKQEWMRFMEAEFDRLDKDKNGELDPKELTKSRVSVRAFHFAQQGK